MFLFIEDNLYNKGQLILFVYCIGIIEAFCCFKLYKLSSKLAQT